MTEWKAELGRLVSPVADSANNLVDTAYAGTTKDFSFIEALRSNSVRRFNTAADFAEYMNNETDEVLKQKLMDAINLRATEVYRNATGTQFNSLDKSQFR